MITAELCDANLYVVGYPKSGNTWLVRLLARSLNLRVERTPMGADGVDLASAVNRDIQRSDGPKVVKMHWLPEQFLKDVDPSPKYLIYICRDPRDVFVSSFFYFRYFRDEKYVRRHRPVGLKDWWHFVAGRFLIHRYLAEFLKDGIVSLGTWGNHLERWDNYLTSDECAAKRAFVRYEDLLTDTAGELRRIMRELGFGEGDIDFLGKIVEQESITNLKNDSEKMFEATGAFDLEYFRRFFRRGCNGDWVNYLTEGQASRVCETFEGAMKNAGYPVG